MNSKTIMGLLKKYKFVLFIFLFTTLFFIIQHQFTISWDFISYVLNAKNMFNSGLYFETFRPPLTSFIIGLFAQILGYAAAEIIYIIIVSALFCLSIILISKQLNFNTELFYLILFTPFVLYFGQINGTELLSVALLLLGIYFIIKNNWISGLFIGFSALTRYTGIVFGVILLFHKGIDKKIKSIILFCLTFIPWFIYSKLKFGNFFTSIADQYHQNITSRLDIAQAPKLIHFISVQSILFVFTLIGLLYILYKLIKKNKNAKPLNNSFSIIMLLLTIYTIHTYFSTPFKDMRYLFTLMLPIGYFTYVGITSIAEKIKKHKIKLHRIYLITIYILLIFSVLISSIKILEETYKLDYPYITRYKNAINTIYKNNLEDCVMYSDAWIFYNYLDSNIIMLPIEIYIKDIPNYQDKVLFLYTPTRSKEQIIALENQLPTIIKTNNIMILGDLKNCKLKENYVELFYIHNSLYTNPCNILFNKIKPIENICYFINSEK